MLKPELYRVITFDQAFLAIMAKPRAGDAIKEEFAEIANCGIKRMVSLLLPAESYQLGLATAAALCRHSGIEFVSFPICDRGVPESFSKTQGLIEDLYNGLLQGINTVIHCRAGIGRTGMISAMLLVRHGYTSKQAIQTISEARGITIPDTLEQVTWVERYYTACHSSKHC